MKKQTSATTETQVKGKTMIDFNGKTIYVGIDIHKKDWQVAKVYEGIVLGNYRMTGNSQDLITHLRKHYPGASFKCAYESSAWGFTLQRQLTAAGMECIVVHAADVPGTNKERANKTDVVDALRLAMHHSKGSLQGIHVPEEAIQKQRNLIRFRKKLVGDINRSKNRLKSLMKYHGIDIPPRFDKANWSALFMKWVEEQAEKDLLLQDTLLLMLEEVKVLRQLLLKTERKLRIMMQSQQYKHHAQLLMSAPGIGLTVSMLFLLEVGDIRRFPTFEQLNNFVGFYPGSHDSGEKEQSTGISTRKHKQLRSHLVEAAWQAIRIDPALLEAYRQLTKRMDGKKAIIRIARKLLRRMRSILLTETPYQMGVVA